MEADAGNAHEGEPMTDHERPPLRPVNVGERTIRFASGSTDQVFAIEVDHPAGRWEQVWVLRDSALADRIVAALAALDAPAEPAEGLDVELALQAITDHSPYDGQRAVREVARIRRAFRDGSRPRTLHLIEVLGGILRDQHRADLKDADEHASLSRSLTGSPE